MPDQYKYDLYFLLGGACACTQILRYCQLQYASYPFDWLMGASITERARMLADGLNDMLHKDSMVLVEKNKRPTGTDYWRNERNGLDFMHDFHQNKSLSEEFPGVVEKYKRRAARLIQQISTSTRVLAVYAERPCDKTELSNQELCEATQILRNAFPGVGIDLLYLHCDESVLISDISETIAGKGITKMRFNYNMCNCYAPYEVNLPMAACALNRYTISERHLNEKNKGNRISFIKSQPSANNLIQRHKLGIKIARGIMEYSLYFRLSKIWHSILKKFYKN